MNETLFFLQILIIISFTWGAFKFGKEALTAWVVILALVANIFVLKQINLFGFNVTASDAFVIGSILGLNLLQEYFNKEAAVKATYICFFFMGFFALVSQIHLLYLSSPYDVSHESFQNILSPTPRLLIASLSVFFITQQLDILFFSFLKKILPGSMFAFRVTISMIISQLFDTVLFSFAGLYGIVESVVDIIIISFAVKLTVIFCVTPFIRWVKA